MISGISQPSSGTCQSTDTCTSSEITQSSTSGQSVDPSHQVQSSEEERNDAVTETSEPSRNTPESTSSGIPGNIDESTSSERTDGSSKQVVSGEWEIVGAGELSRALQSDIPRNTSQSLSSGESTSSTTTQQNLATKQVMGMHAASPRDISRSIFQILDRQSELVKATLLQRERRKMNIISQTSGQSSDISESPSDAPSNDETQSTVSRQSEDLNRIPQQISLSEQITTDVTSRISEQGDDTRESTDTAAPHNKTQKPVNRRPEDSSQESRSRPRHSKRSTSRKDSRSYHSEEASGGIPEDMVNNTILKLNEAIARNPALRLPGGLEMGIPLVIKTNLSELLAECRSVAEMRDKLERLGLWKHASDDPNSEERQNDRQNDRQSDRRGVSGREKRCSRKYIPPRGGGGGAGK